MCCAGRPQSGHVLQGCSLVWRIIWFLLCKPTPVSGAEHGELRLKMGKTGNQTYSEGMEGNTLSVQDRIDV